EKDLEEALRRAFARGMPQVLVEECLRGWKEIEYEVVRDFRDNCITVCNMENLDPLGIHTGDSIVVAPSQTLNDVEYQLLRTLAIKTIRHLDIIGECNIQYALDPYSSDYRVIEVNARLSRSSSLASKATGYPLAYVAAKLGIGFTLPEIPNGITRQTTAFFEPALDYLVCKVPRWDLSKFEGASIEIGSEMKSVGEVMAIGRTFPEVIQKAMRMLDIGVDGLDVDMFPDGEEIDYRTPTPLRLFAIAKAMSQGVSVEEIHNATMIDRWFLHGLGEVVDQHQLLQKSTYPITDDVLRVSKRMGFSDRAIARDLDVSPRQVADLRRRRGIVPHLAQIDTMAGEFPADTNYLYSTYWAIADDVTPSTRKKIMVLGSGAYRIGSSVEFDWCAVSAVNAATRLGYETIMVNYNPETVSTDYDVCDKLIFDEISFESIVDLYEREQPHGVVVSMGGQIPNNLALRLHQAGVKVLGTHPDNIDRAEDRSKFSALLDDLGVDQPAWFHVSKFEEAEDAVAQLGGFPVLVRPSYVLSGAAMSVAHEGNELRRILERARDVSPEHPVVVSKFETHAREIEIDAVADHGEIDLCAISEHVEDAGVHSGDATLVLPPQTLYIPTIRRVREIAATVAKALDITGSFNMQFLAKHNKVKVIECNLRASRSFPFVSKVTGTNFAEEAMYRMLGAPGKKYVNALDLDFVGVKAPMFSFSRLTGADPLLGVEMASTGEVGCLGTDLNEALLHALLATGFRFPKNGVLLSLGRWEDKFWFAEEARTIAADLGLPIYATEGTSQMLDSLGIDSTSVGKGEDAFDAIYELFTSNAIDLVINVPREYDKFGRPDGYLIRRTAIDCGVPLITDRQLAGAVVEALRSRTPNSLQLIALGDHQRGQQSSPTLSSYRHAESGGDVVLVGSGQLTRS
ncbi:MAG: carbamoyl-phosphate synthase (glutamine-hydrolyzing) large subunit, partial [Gammaproteobacteria bacterium]|nr:carbamoyl-phosphate synthase (glutamine-hydrolyzing) large subunit [Gammaproteobacteria bacterium]